MSFWPIALALLATVAYALGSHVLMSSYAHEPWAAAALLGPLLLAGAGFALRSRHWTALLGVGGAAVGLAATVAGGGVGSVERLYVLQHAGIHAALGLSFAASLRGPGLSLIGRLAQQLHPLTPAMERYTARVTLAWVVYFFTMAACSVAVYLTASWAAWSLLANIGTPVAMALMFFVEHRLRYWLHPEFERSSLMDAVRAYRGLPQRPVRP